MRKLIAVKYSQVYLYLNHADSLTDIKIMKYMVRKEEVHLDSYCMLLHLNDRADDRANECTYGSTFSEKLSPGVNFINAKHRHLKCHFLAFKCQKWHLNFAKFQKTLLAFKTPKCGIYIKILFILLELGFKMPKKEHFKRLYFGVLNTKIGV